MVELSRRVSLTRESMKIPFHTIIPRLSDIYSCYIITWSVWDWVSFPFCPHSRWVNCCGVTQPQAYNKPDSMTETGTDTSYQIVVHLLPDFSSESARKLSVPQPPSCTLILVNKFISSFHNNCFALLVFFNLATFVPSVLRKAGCEFPMLMKNTRRSTTRYFSWIVWYWSGLFTAVRFVMDHSSSC